MKLSLPFDIAVPPSWDVRRFGRLVTRSQESGQPGAQLLSVFLDQGVVPRDSREDNFNRIGADLGKYLVVRRDDLVFNKLRTWQGGLGVSAFDGIVSPAYYVCRPMATANSRYLHFLLRSAPYLDELTRISKWMPPSQFDISWDDLSRLPLPVPPIHAQREIADYLDRETARIDGLISAKNRMIKLLGERDVALVETAVLSKDWPSVSLTRAIKRIEQGWSPQCEARLPNEGEWGVLKVGCVNGGVFRANEIKALPEDVPPLTQYEVHNGDFLISRANTRELVGSAAIVDGVHSRTLLCDKLYRVSLDTSKVNPRFVSLYLQTRVARDQIELEATGASSSMQNVGQDTIRGLRIPLPGLEVQAEIVNLCSRQRVYIGKAISSVESQIGVLRERRQALITAAVTGQLDIPEAA